MLTIFIIFISVVACVFKLPASLPANLITFQLMPTISEIIITVTRNLDGFKRFARPVIRQLKRSED